jgi:ATP-dependent DNA ligase
MQTLRAGSLYKRFESQAGKDSVYEPGKRSEAWVKYKLYRSEEFVIGGLTPGNPFTSLLVGQLRGR